MSGGNANSTLSHPGKGWEMLWPYTFDDIQLDVVGFLAILGERSVAESAQVAALSKLFLLPRLIPAPQALFYTSRPLNLPSTIASVTAIHSGMTKSHIYHIAQTLFEYEMPRHEVRCVTVKKAEPRPYRPSFIDRVLGGQPAPSDAEANDPRTPTVRAKPSGPLTWVTLLSFGLAIALLVASFLYGDGASMLATFLFALLSTLTGWINKWTLRLPERAKTGSPPPGDTVIRYPNGSFLVVKCNEDVARELFFAPEEIRYDVKDDLTYRLMGLVGTVMLMLGVIALANARLQLQFGWAAAFIVINAAYWVVSALPNRYHWDLDCYEVQEEGLDCGPEAANFTDAVYKAIVFAGDTKWTGNGEPAIPRTRIWEAWLEEVKAKIPEISKKSAALIRPLPLHPKQDHSPSSIVVVPKDEEGEWNAKTCWDRLSVELRGNSPASAGDREIAGGLTDAIKQATDGDRSGHTSGEQASGGAQNIEMDVLSLHGRVGQ